MSRNVNLTTERKWDRESEREREMWVDLVDLVIFIDLSSTDRNPEPGDNPIILNRLQGYFRCTQL